jgi:short-subunit dehydrogenase
MPLMGVNGTTHVVNISSMGGFQGSLKFSGLAYYSASKAALACLTECLSEEFKDTQIAFNCLTLGSVQTEMLEEAFPGYKAQLQPEEMAEFIGHFALTAHKHMRGKVVPVSLANP